MRLLILYILTFFTLSSCTTSKESVNNSTSKQTSTIEFTIVKEGENSGFTEFGKYFIEKAEGMPVIWDSIYKNYLKKDPIPEIDFEKNEVYLVAMGEQNSGGYSIKVESVKETKKEIVVTVVSLKPGKGCMTTSVMTYPYQLFLIPKQSKSVRFNWVDKVIDCESE
mgnify:CR=1 FL=1